MPGYDVEWGVILRAGEQLSASPKQRISLWYMKHMEPIYL